MEAEKLPGLNDTRRLNQKKDLEAGANHLQLQQKQLNIGLLNQRRLVLSR